MIAGLVVLRKYIHRAPLLRRVVLAPPEGEELEDLGRRESLVDWEHLLGQHGVTTTQLTPSGKARFGDDLIAKITHENWLAFLDRHFTDAQSAENDTVAMPT